MPEKRIVAGVFLLLVVLFSVRIGKAQSLNMEQVDLLQEKGWELSKEEAEKLEKIIEKNPSDLSSRVQLLGYYSRQNRAFEQINEPWVKHAMWVVHNNPESIITRWIAYPLYFYKDVYQEVKDTWLKHVEANRNNTAVLANAATFFSFYDRERSELYLKRAQALEPENPEWQKELSWLYTSGNHNPEELKRELASNTLKELEDVLTITRRDENRFYMLPELAKAAFEAGELEKARTYAIELLGEASRYKENWNYGNAIHQGNLILGRLALKSKDMIKAREYLLEAGKSPGSPQLKTFGPNMALAKELLELDEKDVVIKYLHLCAAFWKEDSGKLKEWESVVNEGLIPGFEQNLRY